MGKHERLEIENAEKIVVTLLNNNPISEDMKQNKWFKHVYMLKEEIEHDFKEIKRAEHIGNIYGSYEIGDIKLLIDGMPVWTYIELKMSESKKGKGTLANISQNALTSSNLFKHKNILSWSEFREKNNFSNIILNKIDEYKDYPSNFHKGSSNTQIKNKGAFLKRLFTDVTKKKGNIANIITKYIRNSKIGNVATIISEIVHLAKIDKISYLKYLSRFEQDMENIKKFNIAMLIGYHTQEQLHYILNIPYDGIFKILDTYFVYYSNEKGGRVVVSKDDLGQEIRDIIKSDMKIIFPEDQTNCIIQSNSNNVLRVAVHWKNKFQGIQTPCLNIFKEF